MTRRPLAVRLRRRPAAFFAPKTPEMAGAVPTSAHLRLVTVPR